MHDVLFVSAAPNPVVADMPAAGRTLVGVHPDVVASLTHLHRIESVTFSDGYGEDAYLPTVGATATLIASKDLTPYEIHRFLDLLNRSRKPSGTSLGWGSVTTHPPYDIKALTAAWDEKWEDQRRQIIKDFALFVLAVGLGTFLLLP